MTAKKSTAKKSTTDSTTDSTRAQADAVEAIAADDDLGGEIAAVRAELAAEEGGLPTDSSTDSSPTIPTIPVEGQEIDRAAIAAMTTARRTTGRWIYVTARDGFRGVASEHWTHRLLLIDEDGAPHYGAAIVRTDEAGGPSAERAMLTSMTGRGAKAVPAGTAREARVNERHAGVVNGTQCVDGSSASWRWRAVAQGDGYARAIVWAAGQEGRPFSAIVVDQRA